MDGKFLRVDGERFYVWGVTYGTFAETELGLFPGLNQVEEDFAAMAAVVGINTACGPKRPQAGDPESCRGGGAEAPYGGLVG